MWRNIGSMDCIRSLIVLLDFWKFIKVVFNSPPETVVSIFTWIKGLEISKHFSKDKVDNGQVSKSPLFISDEIFDVVEFRSSLLQNFNFYISIIFVPIETSNIFQTIINNS